MANDAGVFTAANSNTSAPSAWARLATLAAGGTLQNNAVGFEVDAGNGVIDIRGRDLGNSREFRNVGANRQVAFVVDDIASVNPWVVRCLEVCGTVEALTGQPLRDRRGDLHSSQAHHQLGTRRRRPSILPAHHRPARWPAVSMAIIFVQ